jgi:co-chaperonin GroES (HSP10)
MKPAFSPARISSLRALHDNILVTEMQFDERITSNGIILPNDNGTGSGIRPRWGVVYKIGPKQTHVKEGQWICVAHGRWSRGIDIIDDQGEKTIRKIDPADILLVSDEPPADDTLSDAVNVIPRQR